MSGKKLNGIWPLYGGMRNYALTLQKILRRVSQGNPTTVQLVSWLKSEYKGSSETVPYGVLRVVRKCLGFIQESGDRVQLTPSAEEFLKTGENRLVLDALRDRVIGFDEILSMLDEKPQLSLMEIHQGLLERCGLSWTTTAQTVYRLNWLLSLNFVVKQNGKYRRSGGKVKKLTPSPPPTEPNGPLKDLEIAKSLANADRLVTLGMHGQAIREYGTIMERLLKNLYQNYFPNLPIRCKEKILDYERASRMPINRFTIGQWIGLFRSAGLFSYIAQDRKGKGGSLVFFIPSLLDTLNKLRNKSTHSTTDYDHYINKNTTAFAKATITCILHELQE